MSLSTVIAVLIAAIMAVSNAILTRDQQNSMLYLHNQARALSVSPPAANMMRLVWDETLAASAQAYAATCPQGHSSTPYGENLSFGWPTMSPERAVLEWTAEAIAYDYAKNDCIGGQVCGHFTQQVWASTTRVGCGHHVCALFGQQVVQAYVCHYEEPGNWFGELPYVAGQACSLCPAGYGCVGNLCTKVGTNAEPVPALLAPITAAPATSAPITAAPATQVPITAAPTTAAPTKAAPLAAAANVTSAPIVLTPAPVITLAIAPAIVSAPFMQVIVLAPLTASNVVQKPTNRPFVKAKKVIRIA